VVIPPEIEIRARELVIEAIELGGDLWKYVSPATVELIVEAVAVDLLERGDDKDEPRNQRDFGRPSPHPDQRS